MDFEKYLQDLEDNIQRQFQELSSWDESSSHDDNPSTTMKYCPFCGEKLEEKHKFCPFCGEALSQESKQTDHHNSPSTDTPCEDSEEQKKPHEELPSLYKLPHFETLEEDTKSKIGTFEQIFQGSFQQDAGFQLVEKFGFDTLDYGPLINPLASALEIELNASVISLYKRTYGKNHAFHKTKDIVIELSGKHFTLREIQFCMDCDAKEDKVLDKSGFPDSCHCAKLLGSFVNVRNNASHTKYIGKETFLNFYQNLYSFFETYMESLLQLKINTATKDLSNTPTPDDSKPGKHGIIFTDTVKLAIKIARTEKSAAYFKNLLQSYADLLSSTGINYKLLDMNGFKGEWQQYAQALHQFYTQEYSVKERQEPLYLFIVGGDDVIPMPEIKSPFHYWKKEDESPHNEEIDYYERTVDADLIYAYAGVPYKLFNRKGELDFKLLRSMKPCFWIGRLPLENGKVEKTCDASDPVTSYIQRAVRETLIIEQENQAITNVSRHGVQIDRHVATICESTSEVADLVLQGLPLVNLHDEYKFVERRKFVSPVLDLRNPDPEKLTFYQQMVQEADALTFCLHGSGEPSAVYFFGQSNQDRSQFTIAYDPKLLKGSSVKFIAGFCCWGARFIGYSPEQSVLLTAFRNNALIYMGSCRTAYGYFDWNEHEKRQFGKQSITLANVLLKYYLNFLYQGYDAGEALGRAKLLYLEHPDNEITDILGTIMQFNLFGDPRIAANPILPKQAVLSCKVPTHQVMQYMEDRTYKPEYDNVYDIKDNYLNYVRGLVDNNLSWIRDKINQELYSHWKIEPEDLQSIYSYKCDNDCSGYRLEYRSKYGLCQSHKIVDTDENGNIIRMIESL